jgi:hypothetical protein
MGVASNRLDVHRACAAAERAVERLAEPLAALFVPATEHPDALLRVAWRALLLNSAHDSSCACSADEVVDEVVVERPARPRASGSLHIVAAGERCVVDETLLILPPSSAVARVERFVLGEGVLTIHGLRAGISV